MTWLTVALCLGATLRLWRIYDLDDVGSPLRSFADWLFDKLRHPFDNWLSLLLSCPFCIGFWIALPVVTLGYFHGDSAWFVVPSATLTISYLMGHLYVRLEDERE